MLYKYKYPRPSVTVDIVIIAHPGQDAQVLLVKRAFEPFKDMWALPGGFVDENEDLHETAARELFEETGLEAIVFKQVGAFGKPGRDPRGHTITIGFCSVIPEKIAVKAGDDAKEASWFPLNTLPELAFDHLEILKAALKQTGIVLSNTAFQND